MKPNPAAVVAILFTSLTHITGAKATGYSSRTLNVVAPPQASAIALILPSTPPNNTTAPSAAVAPEFCAPTPAPPSRVSIRYTVGTDDLGGSNWSDPATWGGLVPQTAARVVIPQGKTVILDTDTPHLGSLEVNGTLRVARKDISLTAGYIMVNGTGQFVAGTKGDPFGNRLTITLTGTDRQATSMGGRVLGVMNGGKLELIGKIPTFSWTMLAPNATAQKGTYSITLEKNPEWKPGDEIVITSTDFDYAQTEKRTIAAVSGNTLVLNAPLNYLHYGVITQVKHTVNGVPTEIDERAEVGLLSHYIKIQGAQNIPGVENSETNGFGGHVMIMDDASTANLQGVELYNMGQKGLQGRYPIHWHNVNDGGASSSMTSCSVHRSFNRGTTIHKTNNLRITDNVVFDTLGHGYFLEDGKETGNAFIHNLVALVHKGPLDANFDVHDSHTPNTGAPAAFWITNPNNTFISNAAAGVYPGGFGFWYDLHSIPRPGSISADTSYHPNKQSFGVFQSNRAHSIAAPVQRSGEAAWGFFMDGLYSNIPVVVEDFTTFKNQGGQVWFSGGSSFSVQRSRLTGDNILFGPNLLKDSVAVGRTGNPVVNDPEAWWRNINLKDFDDTIGLTALVGYDAVAHAEHSVFANYRGVFTLRPNNFAGGGARDCTFLNDTNYKTYLIGNIHNFGSLETERSQFTIENKEDSFGNGAVGMFTYTEQFTNSSCKTVTQGMKGLAPNDHLGFWCPYLRTDFVSVGFNNRERYKPGASVYQIYVQPAGKDKRFTAVPGTDFNGGETQRIISKLDTVQNITFTGNVRNANITIMLEDGVTISNYERYVIFEMPAPSSDPTYSSVYYNTVNKIHYAKSVSEFNSSKLTTVFLDKTRAVLLIKLHTPEYLINISGYTLSPEITALTVAGLPSRSE